MNHYGIDGPYADTISNRVAIVYLACTLIVCAFVMGLAWVYLHNHAPDHQQSIEKKVQEICGDNSGFTLIDQGVYQCYLKNGKKTIRVIVKE